MKDWETIILMVFVGLMTLATCYVVISEFKELKGELLDTKNGISETYIGNPQVISSRDTVIKIMGWHKGKWIDDDLGTLPRKFQITDLSGRWQEIIECDYSQYEKLLYNCKRGNPAYNFTRVSRIDPIWYSKNGLIIDETQIITLDDESKQILEECKELLEQEQLKEKI